MEIVVKKVSTVPELIKCAELERKVWGSEPIPVHQTSTAAKNGGLVIAAYAGDEVIGYSYGFSGFKNGETYLCSHMLGIDPDYRNQNIGYRLKLAQAEEARKLGYGKIRWTYDPMETRNAYLNIFKLGAICSDYIENCYGEMTDELNRGVPSDRFNVEWLVNSPHLQQRQAQFAEMTVQPEHVLLSFEVRADGFPQVSERLSDWGQEAKYLFVPAPVNFQEMKKADRTLAIDWRMQTRQVFTEAFARGFAVAHIITAPGEPVLYYVLVRRTQLSLG